MMWRIPIIFIVIIITSYLLFNLIASILPDSPTATEVLLLLISLQGSFIISLQVYILQKRRSE